jgi:uncharacterized protein
MGKYRLRTLEYFFKRADGQFPVLPPKEISGDPKMEIASTGELIAYLKDRKPFLRERFGVTRIGVFGSFARGGQSLESDIDLVVELEKSKKNIHSFFQLRRLLEKELSRKVDLGFEHSLKPIVRENIKGTIIYV